MKNKSLPFLSKTKYLDGLKCDKLLWYEYNRKEDLPEVDSSTQAIMDQGTAVGKLAQTLFPGGIAIQRDYKPDKQSEKSLESAKLRKPLFEAGFIFKQAYALVDILNPVANDAWDLIEVKSSSSVKDEHYYDVAFQKYTYEGAGLKIRKCYLMYINNQYVRKGKIEPEKLFAEEDVTKQADALIPEIEANIADMFEAIRKKIAPQVKIGRHCSSPYSCPLQDTCWDFLPKKGDIFCLYSGKKKAYELLERGVLSIADIKEDVKLSDKQSIQVECHKTSLPYVDKKGIKDFIDTLEYPLYFLDFETINPAIPAYDNTKPFETIPFQYSLYVIKCKGMKPEHHSYLAPGDKDPRPEILKQLKTLLGNSGSVIAYNASFEKTVLRHASEAYPKYQGWVSTLEERVIDLLVPFRSFLYYHPGQEGSASLKKVLPVLTKSNYDNMEIADGGMASIEYCRVTFGQNIAAKERQRVRAALEKYCDLDTKGMIEILEGLRRESS
ncbi:MAG: DUF2779 domain-containing protein [Candidatus Omnitrophica bacterium]|nr:DUF2779 domain-containing protein [Candidatus Omnitrophota bacterium]MCG2712165.1 DUF2779 domain-containing protein [Candidatus Omnitrophota bacterium]